MSNGVGRDALEVDVDTRLVEVWEFIDQEFPGMDLNVIGPLVRMAYGRGYCDAHTEDLPGRLYRDHGFKLPQRARIG